jgi:glycopeptide antibiotics resistance protein
MRESGFDAGAALVLAAVAVVLVLVAAGVVRHRWGNLARLPFLVLAGTLLYGLAVVAFTLLPLPPDQAAACNHPMAGWHLVPLRSFAEASRWARGHGLGAFLTSGTFLQIPLNVVLLVPLGLLIGWRGRRRVWVAVAAGLAVSIAIEATQGTGVWFLYDCAYRYAEIDDLITNTAGAALGWLLGRALARRVPWPERRRSPAPGGEAG